MSLNVLSENRNPGRLIVVGLDETRQYLVQVAGLTGRSPGSRNRVYSEDEKGRVYTEPADASKVSGDPSLTIYSTMLEDGRCFAVSNGLQTEDILSAMTRGGSFIESMDGWSYEADESRTPPIYTPRISGSCIPYKDGTYKILLSILRKSRWGMSCDRQFFAYEEMAPGFGVGLTTYSVDGNPPLPFWGEPFVIPLTGDIEAVANSLWRVLNEDNRVAIATRFIDLKTAASTTHIINKNTKVGA